MLLMAIMIVLLGLCGTTCGCLIIRDYRLWVRIWGTALVIVGACVGAIGAWALLTEVMRY